MPDPEIEAMSAISDALSTLNDADACSRVLRWAAARYEIELPQVRSATRSVRMSNGGGEMEDEGEEAANGGFSNPPSNGSAALPRYEHFAELFDAFQPKTPLERALAAAYWEQEIAGKSNWQSYSINVSLKNLGHYDERINHTLASGMQKKPALVLQLKKAGSARQGRKTYKLSAEGIKYVRARIAQG